MTRFLTTRLSVGLVVALVMSFAGPVLDAGMSATSASSSATKHSKKHKRKKHKKKAKKVAPVVPAPAGSRELTGVFMLKAGSYSSSTGASGSYFRMVIPGGSADRGPFFSNPDSSATDKSFTLFNPGIDGGLITGAFQDPPAPAFAGNGNALAKRIVVPTKFGGVDFSVVTSSKDPQTGAAVAKPTVAVADGKLSGKLQAFAAQWNRQSFNQGSPKPDGSTPGITTPVHGTYDETTHAFVLEWASSIVGGPFNGFTGVWHLEGSFLGCGV
jgi:hypothetical protein